MPDDIMFRRESIRGRRLNATPESDIPEEVKRVAIAENKQRSRLRRAKTLSVIAAVFVWIPFFAPLVFFIHGAITGYPAPIGLYPILVLAFRVSANLGGLLLYLASRAVNALRKPVGWLALAILILPFATILLMSGQTVTAFDPARVSGFTGTLAFIFLALTLLSMLALCVFSILIILRAFRKTAPVAAE